MENNIPTLPNDIILQILSRCPIKTLLRFIRSSKFIRNLIKSDRRFAYSHLRLAQAARQTNEIHVMTSSNVCSSDSDGLETSPVLKKINYPDHTSSRWYLGECFHVAGSSHGIICLYQFGSNYAKVYLWNPTLNQIRALPEYLEDCSENDFIGFGFDTENQQHKFVRIRSSSPTVDIYNLWNDSWKSFTHHLSCQDCRTSRYPTVTKSVELNGSLHWVSNPRFIIMFGLSDERVSELKIPPEPGVSLGVLKGCLSLLDFRPRKYEIWSLKGESCDRNGEFSWIRTFIHEPHVPFYGRNIELIELTTNGKIIMTKPKQKIVSYDPETKKVEKSGPFDANNRYRSIDYVASLISVWPSKRIVQK